MTPPVPRRWPLPARGSTNRRWMNRPRTDGASRASTGSTTTSPTAPRTPNSPETKSLVTETLQYWKTDADLADIRDEEALKALPEPERKACRALWDEVNRVLDRSKP